MKKSVVVSAFNSLLLVGIAKAEPDDVAATLAVSGTVESSTNGCNVSLDKSAMELGSWDINTLPLQGIFNQKTSSNENIARLEGDNCTSNNGAFIGLKFMGPADQTAGNSFLNTAQGQNAATGVAVSVYGYNDHTAINPNTSTRLVYSGDTFRFYVGMVRLVNTSLTPGNVESAMTLEVDRL